ncbi:pentatricopeptide repeat-containing protein At1g59720, chloroplastic/mitochondrial-like [Nicotiana tabacum]|uniref:Pentatricopeptide repeat-containing protein At1g59720, chloroplastic/mitochondrial-like n=1 Tax=Nicotiana tabacum TaxID=4097 RepID=A0AC58TGQ3_TOBAC
MSNSQSAPQHIDNDLGHHGENENIAPGNIVPPAGLDGIPDVYAIDRNLQVFGVIEERLNLAGYVPDLSQASMVDELDNGKRRSLKLHSERLAIAYGLLKLKPRTPISIFKNLRICSDCHNVTKLISKVFDVEIIVRDRVRFH